MRFEILHTTDYRYDAPASEAYVEARLTPPSRPSQRIAAHDLTFHPAGPSSTYVDYFGNPTSFYSMVKRHDHLRVSSRLLVDTSPPRLPEGALDLTIGEARQILSSVGTDIFDYLRAPPAVPSRDVSRLDTTSN